LRKQTQALTVLLVLAAILNYAGEAGDACSAALGKAGDVCDVGALCVRGG